MRTAKNYMTDGGDTTVIGGALIIEEGASVEGMTTATIIDALTSDDAAKALSAKQGKALKTLVDAKYTAANAAEATAGLVKQSANVALAAGEAPTKAEFDALITALIAAGIVASGA